MPWFKVDDKFHSHPKVMELSLPAVGLWTLAGSWCADYLTDGEIRRGQLRRLGGSDDAAAELVEAGLWEETEGGYRFCDWHDYQPTKESVESKREAETAGAARGNHTRWHVARGVVSPNCEFCSQESGTRSGTRSGSDQVAVGSASGSASGSGESAPNPPEPVPGPVPVSPDGDTERDAPAGKSRRKPATTIPDDWQPTDAHRQKADERGVNLEREAEQFKLHAEANDRRCVNWNSAFAMWLNKARPDAGPQRNLSGPERQQQISAERHQRIMQGQFSTRTDADSDPSLWMPRQIEEA